MNAGNPDTTHHVTGRRVPVLLVAAAWLVAASVASPAFGSTVKFGAVLPHGQMMDVPIVSMQERRYLNLVRQEYDFSCGAASLATLLRYAYGLRLDEETVLAGMMGVADQQEVRARGFSLLEMKRYLERLGYRGRGYRIDLERLETVNVPTIALMNVDGYHHFVVVKHARDGYVHVADPALGNRRYSFDEFIASWPSRTVFAVIGPGFDRHTALLESTDIPSSGDLHRRSGEVPTADLLEFGFKHADFF
ncbi:MAG: C39 family peptidase [Guyparkeria sp.]|uniref:C39 family peptidase n=1 Tax=Guyparkeria sp. TaxID=2035736 RepID=UPI00397D3BD6